MFVVSINVQKSSKKHDFWHFSMTSKNGQKWPFFDVFQHHSKTSFFSCFSTSISLNVQKIFKRTCHAHFFSVFFTFWKIFFKICRKLSKLLGNYGRNSRKYPTRPRICRVFDCGHITFRNIGPKSHYTYWIRGPPNFRGPLQIVEKQGGTPPSPTGSFLNESSVTHFQC